MPATRTLISQTCQKTSKSWFLTTWKCSIRRNPKTMAKSSWITLILFRSVIYFHLSRNRFWTMSSKGLTNLGPSWRRSLSKWQIRRTRDPIKASGSISRKAPRISSSSSHSRRFKTSCQTISNSRTLQRPRLTTKHPPTLDKIKMPQPIKTLKPRN